MDVHHDFTGIATVALAAMACGILFVRLRQPAIVGYIIAGVLLGPSLLGLVSDRKSVSLLAELGVIMLLFVIGLELSVLRFSKVWKIALVTTLLQIGGSVGLMMVVQHWLGWSVGTAVLLGFVVALSSTAVVIKLLEQLGESDSPAGRLTVGILIAQDMAVVPMMLSLSTLTGAGLNPIDGIRVAGSVLLLAAVVYLLLKREIRLPLVSMVAGHADLGPLAAFAACFGAATLAGLLDLSPGYGAFLAGMVLGNSRDGQRLRRHAHPIQALLLMVFFLSVGLLLDLQFLWDNLGTVLIMLAAVTLFKTLLNVAALRVQRVSWSDAFLVGVALAQIGEFSFLLASTGVARRVIEGDEAQLVVAVTVLSLMISPLWLGSARRLAASGTAFSSLGHLLSTVYAPEARRVGLAWGGSRRLLVQLRQRWRAARGLSVAGLSVTAPATGQAQVQDQPQAPVPALPDPSAAEDTPPKANEDEDEGEGDGDSDGDGDHMPPPQTTPGNSRPETA